MTSKTARGHQGTCKEKKRIDKYADNALIQSFLKTPEHQRLYQTYMDEKTKEAEEALDRAFQKYYVEIRLIRILSNTLKRHAIRYDQKRKQQNQRLLLILDQPASCEADTTTTNLDLIKDSEAIPVEQAVIEKEDRLENKIENPALYHAIRSLTPRQRHVLESYYLKGMTDTEIATKEGVSQQSISKVRNNTLSKLKTYLLEWDKHERCP